MTATELPPAVVYQPGQRRCQWTWRYNDDYGQPPTLVEEFVICPSWSMTGEDGTTYTVFREVGEVNGYVADPDGTRRTCWDLGQPGVHTPLGRCDHRPEAEQATDTELAAMNRILRPLALADDWETELSRLTPCPHDHRCERSKEPTQ